jgi:murein DD-endopeptidase MepM/ murein hydrolase activator NlpD
LHSLLPLSASASSFATRGLVGHEPPLLADTERQQAVGRTGVNLRWLLATVLTGITSAALLGGAVTTALREQSEPPRAAELLQLGLQALGQAGERMTNVARKGNKLSPLTDLFSGSKQIIQVSQTITSGNRETIRSRPYARVATRLALTGTPSADIPAFNPLRLLAGDQAERQKDESENDSDADVSIVQRDLFANPGDLRSLMPATIETVMSKVRSEALLQYSLPLWSSDTSQQSGQTEQLPSAHQIFVEKLPSGADHDSLTRVDRTMSAKPGDTMTSLLLEAGASRDESKAIVALLTRSGRNVALVEGQRMRIEFGAGPTGGRPMPVRITLLSDRGQDDAVALGDDGRYVPVEWLGKSKAPVATAKAKTDEDEVSEDAEDEGGIKLYTALYETALRQNMPKTVIDDMIRLFAQDTDFNRRADEDDQFEILYADDEAEAGRSEILFASLTHGSETRRYYRFANPDDGAIDYYDGKGKSARKFLLRKPIAGGIMRSTFGMRRHPILGYTKLHSGVDWADRIGTPIVAAGNGRVALAEWSSGYGRRVEIEHANGYMTTYNHMSRFAKGVSEGSSVRQGQVIGYLGASGLATGPHLHYEVLVNGRFVDPLRVRVPKSRELDGQNLAQFQTERARLDQLLNRDPAVGKLSANVTN